MLCFFRCSFHSYADSTYAKHLETGGGTQSIYGTLGGPTPIPSVTPTPGGGGGGPGNGMAEATMTMRAETPREYQQSVIEVSEDSINSIEKVEEWKVLANGNRMPNGASPRENGKQYLLFFGYKCPYLLSDNIFLLWITCSSGEKGFRTVLW